MSTALIATLLLCAGATDAPPPVVDGAATTATDAPMLEGTVTRATWDMTGDFHLGRVSRRMDWAAFMGKVRFGGLWVSSPWAWSVGAQVQVSNVEAFTFGIEGELTHVATGFWGQVGAVGDVEGRGGATAGVGWSIVGVSTGVRAGPRSDPYWSMYFVVRIPAGLFAVLGG